MAFDTVDHSILITRLCSWFAFHCLNPICYLDLSLLSVNTSFSVLLYSSCTLPHSVLSFHLFL